MTSMKLKMKPKTGDLVRVNLHNGWITRVIEAVETTDPETGDVFEVKLRIPLFEVLLDLGRTHKTPGPANVFLQVRAAAKYQAIRIRLFENEFTVMPKTKILP